jgi:hypothetical protein
MEAKTGKEGVKIHSFDPPDGGPGPAGKTAGYGIEPEDLGNPAPHEPASFDPPDGGPGPGGKPAGFPVGDTDE